MSRLSCFGPCRSCTKSPTLLTWLQNATTCYNSTNRFLKPHLNRPAQPQNTPRNRSKTRDFPSKTREKPSLAVAKRTRNFATTNGPVNLYAIVTPKPSAPRTFFPSAPMHQNASGCIKSQRCDFPPAHLDTLAEAHRTFNCARAALICVSTFGYGLCVRAYWRQLMPSSRLPRAMRDWPLSIQK
jgi:hypothetical protein